MSADLVAFLRARLDEDEAVARAAARQKVAGPLIRWHSDSVTLSLNDALELTERKHIARHDPARVLRQVEAGRAIVDWWEVEVQPLVTDLYAPSPLLCHLAVIYRDHEDYREEWALYNAEKPPANHPEG